MYHLRFFIVYSCIGFNRLEDFVNDLFEILPYGLHRARCIMIVLTWPAKSQYQFVTWLSL